MAYLLTLASALITSGYFADIHGFLKIYQSGFAVFNLASLLCAVSPSTPVLTGCRITQGPGAAMLLSIGGAMSAIFLLGRVRGWALVYTSPIIISTSVVVVLGASIFIYRESHLKETLIQLALLKNRNYTLGNTGLMCVFILYLGTIFLLLFYFGKSQR